MSFIHYKFRSAKDVDTINFEGLGLPLWELKKEIIQAKRLGSANDFDLVVTNAQSNEGTKFSYLSDFTDDYQMVHKNSSVIVKRVPLNPSKKSSISRIMSIPSTSVAKPMNAGSKPGDSEDTKIQAMMTESNDQWSKAQFDQSSKRPLKKFNTPQRPPPPNYTCFRCGQKDHYIQNCPLSSNSAVDVPRVKKTTGIPKTFLKAVDPTKDKNLVSSISAGSIMMNPDGNLVIARPNAVDWDKVVSVKTESNVSSILASVHIPLEFKCPICKNLLNDAVSTPCCESLFCDECIRKVVVESPTFSCFNCRQECMPDKLQPAESTRKKIEEFMANASSGSDLKKGNEKQDEIKLPEMPAELSSFYEQMNQIGREKRPLEDHHNQKRMK